MRTYTGRSRHTNVDHEGHHPEGPPAVELALRKDVNSSKAQKKNSNIPVVRESMVLYQTR